VTAQLARTDDGVRRWSNTLRFGRSGDVLTLQKRAGSGRRARDGKLRRQRHVAFHAASANPEAYDFYLHGLTALDRYDREGFEAGLNYFQQRSILIRISPRPKPGIGAPFPSSRRNLALARQPKPTSAQGVV